MLHHLIEPHLITVLITVDSYVYTIVQNNSLQNGCIIYRQLFATNYISSMYAREDPPQMHQVKR